MTTPAEIQAELQAFLDGPAGTPPAGILPNFHDPPNLDLIVIFTLAICVAATTFAVVIRMYTKKYLIRSWAFEDCETFIPWLPGSAISLILTRRSFHRMGKKPSNWNIDRFNNAYSFAKLQKVSQLRLLVIMVWGYTYGMYR